MNNNSLKKWLKKFKLNESTVSMVLGVLVVIVVGALIVNYFQGINREKKETESETTTPTSGEVKLIEEQGKLYPEGLPTTHRVAKGESLWTIAEKYYGSGYNWVSISKENKLSRPNYLLVGQNLNIPKAEVIKLAVKDDSSAYGPKIEGSAYTVVKGDHLWGIAVRAFGDGYRWSEIAKINNIANPNLIRPGQVLDLSIPTK